eukprot:PhM_4_TR12905/c0_g1_i1/m.105964
MADLTDWPTICTLREEARASEKETEVYKNVSVVLGNRLAEAHRHIEELKAALDGKSQQLSVAVADLVAARSSAGFNADVAARLTSLERERDDAIDRLIGATAKYNEDVDKHRSDVETLQGKAMVVQEMEAQLEAARAERDTYKVQNDATERKLVEWKSKVGSALRDAKEKEATLNETIDRLALEKRDLLDEIEHLRGKIRATEDRKLGVDVEAQTDAVQGIVDGGGITLFSPRGVIPPMDAIMSVRYVLTDGTFLESKIGVKDNISIDDLIALCCRKMALKTAATLEPDEMCLMFSLGNQPCSSALGTAPARKDKEKEFMLTGNRELRSWTVLRQLIVSNQPVVLVLSRRMASPQLRARSPKRVSF